MNLVLKPRILYDIWLLLQKMQKKIQRIHRNKEIVQKTKWRSKYILKEIGKEDFAVKTEKIEYCLPIIFFIGIRKKAYIVLLQKQFLLYVDKNTLKIPYNNIRKLEYKEKLFGTEILIEGDGWRQRFRLRSSKKGKSLYEWFIYKKYDQIERRKR